MKGNKDMSEKDIAYEFVSGNGMGHLVTPDGLRYYAHNVYDVSLIDAEDLIEWAQDEVDRKEAEMLMDYADAMLAQEHYQVVVSEHPEKLDDIFGGD